LSGLDFNLDTYHNMATEWRKTGTGSEILIAIK